MKKIVLFLFLLCAMSIFASNAAVWTLDEQRNSSNLTVLRFKIKNTGSQNISGLELHYYITHPIANLANPNAWVVIGQADKEYAGQIHARRITIHQGSRLLWIKEGQNAVSPVYSYH